VGGVEGGWSGSDGVGGVVSETGGSLRVCLY